MTFREQMQSQGDILFRWRSYVPLIALPVLVLALEQSNSLEVRFGTATEAVWRLFCIAVAMSGLAIRAIVVATAPRGTSGRNTRQQVAEVLNTTGVYSLVRHPLYLGNFLIMLGIVLSTGVWWFVLLCALAFWLYYERIIFAEEAFLESKFGDVFRHWAAQTPTFIPRLSAWRPTSLGFSTRNVLRREYSGLMMIVALSTLVEVLGEGLAEGEWGLQLPWALWFGSGAFAYLVLLTIKRKTTLLNVEGR